MSVPFFLLKKKETKNRPLSLLYKSYSLLYDAWDVTLVLLFLAGPEGQLFYMVFAKTFLRRIFIVFTRSDLRNDL